MRETRDDAALLLQAALDGELDAVGMIGVEARLAADPALAAEYARLLALRDVIRLRLPRENAPQSLRARVAALTSAAGAAPALAPEPSPARVIEMTPAAGRAQAVTGRLSWRSGSPYRSLAASLMLGVLLGVGGVELFRVTPDDEGERALVASYVRGRLSGQPVDVATSDRHTVKPWFAGKIASPTTVLDLAKDGFPLVGGRIDVVGARPVSTLVYQRREHQVALTERPAPDGAAAAPRRKTRDGYAMLDWASKGVLYTAVSDLPASELDAFGDAFRRAATAEREEASKP